MEINSQRLWRSLMEMAQIGATAKGGVCRLSLTNLDQQGRALFIRWCQEAGCHIRLDAVGNIFARRPGQQPHLPPVMTGSHLDSQMKGGKFDGAYGVLAGLEVIRSLNDHQVQTDAPVEVVVWTNEEGTRFSPCMLGSGVYAEVFDLDYALQRTDIDGITVGQELQRLGYDTAAPHPSPPAVGAYFEAHIEQGPVLEAAGKTIGIVTGAYGQRWYDVTVQGMEAHAGPTPMTQRQDALLGAAQLITAVNQIGLGHQPHSASTVGFIQVTPNSRNVIPGQVKFSVDFRHLDDAALAMMDEELRAAGDRLAATHSLTVQVEQISYFQPTLFHPACVAAVRQSTERLGYSHIAIPSGAAHDAVYLARLAPTGMIFVPCENGISHNEIENALPDDLAAGCNVLLQAMLSHAYQGQAAMASV